MQRSSVGPSRRRWIATLDINILPFAPKVKHRLRPAQRHAALKLEVIFCVHGVISPLLANIYLHYAFDLWVKQWRGRHARGDVIAVRYADDWVAGFQFRDDAERFRRAVTERLGQFGLKLHPDKTRLIEFGRFARENRRRKGQGKPQTFDFLGFTHCCGKTRKGHFTVLRLTSAKRLRAKLQAVKLELRRRMHRPIPEQGRYLNAVVAGHGRYFGVPNRLIARWMPRLHICHPYPNQRLIVTTQGKSRVP